MIFFILQLIPGATLAPELCQNWRENKGALSLPFRPALLPSLPSETDELSEPWSLGSLQGQMVHKYENIDILKRKKLAAL